MICQGLGAAHVGELARLDGHLLLSAGCEVEEAGDAGRGDEYIFDRADRSRPKLSTYTIYTESQAIDRFGATPLPVLIVVGEEGPGPVSV